MLIYLKSKEEIAEFREVGKIASKIIKKLLSKTREGTKTLDIDDLTNEECHLNNVKPTFLMYHGFPKSICVSVNECVVHGIPDEYVLKNGDVVSLDLGITKNGFIADTAHTIQINGNHNIIDVCKKCLENGIKQAIPGNNLFDVSSAIYKSKQNYSMPLYLGGHGISKNKLHDDPFVPNIPELSSVKLQKGMVIAIEPMLIDSKNCSTIKKNWNIYAKGISAHFEHTILINDEPEILTK
jgi:methionyl aminopeptidase